MLIECRVKLVSVSFGKNLIIFEHFLDFSTDVPASSYHSLLQTTNQLLLEGGSLWRETIFRNQDLDAW